MRVGVKHCEEEGVRPCVRVHRRRQRRVRRRGRDRERLGERVDRRGELARVDGALGGLELRLEAADLLEAALRLGVVGLEPQRLADVLGALPDVLGARREARQVEGEREAAQRVPGGRMDTQQRPNW